MTTVATKQDQTLAVEFFEKKLAFEVGPIGLKYLLESKEPIEILDLRTPELYAKGHVPGSKNISYEDIEAGRAKLNRDATIVVYCYDAVCHLSAKAALALAKQGYKVKELIGGFDEWASHELTIEKQAGTCGSSCG